MPEEVIRESAATSEPPRGLISPEFFFLLQRIDSLEEKVNVRLDRLEERLSGEIRAVDAKLTGEINKLGGEIKAVERSLSDKFDALKLWAIGTVVAVVVGFAGVVIALIQR